MNASDQTLLLAIDLDDTSLLRLERSYENLKLLGKTLILLYVFEKNTADREKRSDDYVEKEKLINQLAENIHNKTGMYVKTVFQTGNPSEEILKASESYQADLIIMSAHSHPEDDYTRKNALGTTTSKVVRQSKIPVITFNSNVFLKPIRKILLPLDLTVETKQKVTNAIDLARIFNASINIVSVLYSVNSEDVRFELTQQLDRVKKFIEEVNIPCTTELIETDGGERMMPMVILQYAESIDADLIMIMTQQENKLVEFFVGSAAMTILRLSNIPVLSIIPKDLGFIRIGG
jgi:nucleotide-binding universal stress UspA family protein